MMKITPLDTSNTFKKGRPYDAGEVDSFLEMVRIEMEESCAKSLVQRRTQAHQEPTQRADRTRKDAEDAIISTQRVAEDIKANAQKEAEIIIAEAPWMLISWSQRPRSDPPAQ
jgi:cell division initiation protein